MDENDGPDDDLLRTVEDDAGDHRATGDLDADEISDDVVGGAAPGDWRKL